MVAYWKCPACPIRPWTVPTRSDGAIIAQIKPRWLTRLAMIGYGKPILKYPRVLDEMIVNGQDLHVILQRHRATSGIL